MKTQANRSELRIVIYATRRDDNPNADQKVIDLHNEIMDLVGRRLAGTKYRFSWSAGSAGSTKALAALIDHCTVLGVE